MIVSFRPHTLSYQITTEGREDENGDFHPGETSFAGEIPCRCEPNGGKAEVIVFDDGTTSVYRYIIYMDRDCKEFKKDEKVRVSRKDGSVLVEAKVLGFQRGQLNARIWV